jgi:GMP synthase-like glutamine amidotransferase
MGWNDIQFTPEARAKYPFLPESHPFISWHGDTFGLPEGATRIGSTKPCPEQGFIYEDHVVGLQFHPEATTQMLNEHVEHYAEALKPNPRHPHIQRPEKILENAESKAAAAHQILEKWLDAFFK